jgi:putative ABC transport system permease protein
MRALVGIMPANTPRLEGVFLDRVVLGFTLLISMASGLIFGLIPALQTAQPDTSEMLKEGGRGSSGGPARHRARALLVVSEVSLALVLLIGAGLMMKSFFRLLDADPGFSSDRVLVMVVSLPEARYDQPAKSRAFFEQVLERLDGTPGIEARGITTPLLGGWQTGFRVEGQPEPPPGQGPSTDIARVGGDFFQVMGIRLIRGRTFTEQDREGQPLVCIVDETMARTYWPGEDPIGKRLHLGGGGHDQPEKPWLTVVGVVAHVKNYGVDQESRVETYVPALQDPIGFAVVVVKTSAETAGVTSAVRAAVQAVDKDVPVFSTRPLAEIVADSRAPKRLSAQLLAGFAVLALLLAAIGIYGVMSYSVTQQTREIGIRVALGAQRRDILKMVVGQGMALAAIGVALGLAMALSLAFGLTEVLSTVLFRVSRTDPPTYALVPVVLTLVALAACYVPARRALRIEPMHALRYE